LILIGAMAGTGKDSGLTLIELSFAILILTGSFMVLISLHSSSVEQAIRSRNSQHAMLVARRIMAAIEASENSVDIQSREASALDILYDLMPQSPESIRTDQNDVNLNNMGARLDVQYWEMPGLESEAVKRVMLEIFWGENSYDAFRIVYFIPGDGSEHAEMGFENDS